MAILSLPHSPPLSSSPPPTSLPPRPLLPPLHLDYASPEHHRSLSIQPGCSLEPFEGLRRCYSDLVAPSERGEELGKERIQAWRETVLSPDDDDNEDETYGGEEEEGEEGRAFPFVDPPPFASSRRGSKTAPLASPVNVGPPIDDTDEAFLALAALHDPALFHSPSGLATPPFEDEGGPSQLREGEEGDQSSTLQVDFGRGRRKEKGVRGVRDVSEARTIASVEMTRKAFHGGGMKGEPSVEVQPRIVSSPPLQRSPPQPRHPPSTPPLSKSASSRSKHGRTGSSASEQLQRLQSTSPPLHRSTLASTFPHHIQRPDLKRRFSSFLPGSGHENQPPPPGRATSSNHPRAGSASDALSKYLSSGRRSSLPASTPTSPAEALPPILPTQPSTTPHGRNRSGSHSHLDLRHLASSAALSISEHLHSLPSFPSILPPHLHFHTAPSPSPRVASPSPFSFPFPAPLPSPSTTTGRIPWSAVSSLKIRFRPGGGSSGNGCDSSVGANQLVLGLSDLEAGGSREWDPRVVEEDEGEKREKREWPSVTTEMGSPPRVEVLFQGGGKRVCEVGGMSAEQIVDAVLASPT